VRPGSRTKVCVPLVLTHPLQPVHQCFATNSALAAEGHSKSRPSVPTPDYLAAASISPGSGFSNPRERFVLQ
jgi:hypothetical protein